MKKLARIFLLLSLCAMLAISAHAESTGDILREYGFSDVEIQAFDKLLSEIEPDISEDALKTLLTEYIGSNTASLQGSISEGVYTHPSGFSFTIPEGWTINEDPLGLSAFLIEDSSDGEFSSSISVLVMDELREEFETATQEDWDAYFSKTLTDYALVAYESFTYLDAPAHEFVCLHRYNDATLLQYQLFFNKDGKSYVITMTTSEENTIHDNALAVYDELLVHFDVSSGEGNG